MPCDDFKISYLDESADNTQVKRENEIASSSGHQHLNKNNQNQHADSDYHDIEGYLDLQCSSVIQNIKQDYERPVQLPKTKLSCSPISSRLNGQQNELGPTHEHRSDLYLQPINV